MTYRSMTNWIELMTGIGVVGLTKDASSVWLSTILSSPQFPSQACSTTQTEQSKLTTQESKFSAPSDMRPVTGTAIFLLGALFVEYLTGVISNAPSAAQEKEVISIHLSYCG